MGSEDRVLCRAVGSRRRLEAVGLAGVVAAGVVLRFVTTSHLWLDEALSVNIARLPLSDIPEALRHDGHPPLYYFLLHGWMSVFGEGDVAVRALSGIFGLATLPLAWIAGRRLAGRAGAWSALVVLSVSPFAVRYATETRMYSVVMVLVLVGYLLVSDAIGRPSAWRLVAIALLSGALLLTHYWAMWLLVAVLATLAWRGRTVRTAWRVAGAVAAGGIFLVPWLPSLLEQAAHTGTPWAPPVRPTSLVATTVTDFAGDAENGEARLLAILLVVLVLIGLAGRAIDRHRIELDVRTVPGVRTEVAVVALTLAIASAAGYLTGTAFASRYAAAIFPLVVLAAGVGLSRFEGRVPWAVASSVIVLLGLVGCGLNVVKDRTQAGDVAAAIAAGSAPGDAVVFCPDQLGPAVDRLLPTGLDEMTYPELGRPERVDWADYEERNQAADPAVFVGRVLDRVPPAATIWLVSSPAYRTLEGQCEAVAAQLSIARPGAENVVVEDGDEFFEHEGLLRFPGAP